MPVDVSHATIQIHFALISSASWRTASVSIGSPHAKRSGRKSRRARDAWSVRRSPNSPLLSTMPRLVEQRELRGDGVVRQRAAAEEDLHVAHARDLTETLLHRAEVVVEGRRPVRFRRSVECHGDVRMASPQVPGAGSPPLRESRAAARRSPGRVSMKASRVRYIGWNCASSVPTSGPNGTKPRCA